MRSNQHACNEVLQGCNSDVLVQTPQTQTLAPTSGAGSSVEEAIRSTSTVDAAPAAPPSQAAAEMTGAFWQMTPRCSAVLRNALHGQLSQVIQSFAIYYCIC